VNRLGLSVAEFCEVTGLGRSTVYRMIEDEEIPAVPLGTRKVIPYAWVEQQFADAVARWENRGAAA
jgi:excisionase family DNA binding protein